MCRATLFPGNWRVHAGVRMDNVVTRGIVSTGVWQAGCKDCAAERQASGNETVNAAFEYSDDWARRTTERGNSRSDRCERHRREHRRNIQSLAVAYVDLQTIGDVADRSHPTGPLGGLGPLPIEHSKVTHQSDLAPYAFGMKDSDILDLLSGLKHRRVAVIEAVHRNRKVNIHAVSVDDATCWCSIATHGVWTDHCYGTAEGGRQSASPHL
jgi:hypothetical protein